MNFNLFLDEELRNKYYVVKLLELKQNTFFSQGQLMELLGISKYKLERYFVQIVEESTILNLKIDISVEPSGEMHISGLDNLATKKFRLYYLQESKQYQLLIELLTAKNHNSESIANKLFLSRASFYNELKVLKENLKDFNLKIKNLKIIGNEVLVRSFFFSLFTEFYSGLGMPFSTNVKHKITEFKQLFLVNEGIFPTRVQEYRLDIFLGISFLRIEKKEALTQPILELSDIEIYPYAKFYAESLNKNVLAQKSEIQHFYFFCYTENLINEIAEWNVNLNIDKEVEKITNNFLLEFESFVNVDEEHKQMIRKELCRINRKWLYFHFQESTFIFDSQKSYFQEVYFRCDSLIRSFLKKTTLNEYFKSEEEQVKIYYDYLFLVTTVIPIHFLEEAIYVCVDFSHGKFYNEFIQSSIESFRNLNIVFEHKVTNHTQIYISDFILENLTCQQVVWKNPPGPNEWKKFGNLVVGLKGGEV
ncbi:helix-turn-helix domain-containing protein [Enterococcus faecalis]|nr:helix-turn-helix domain-containing protein [Enterococcus faecalis]